ncbi:hypothetical protein LPC10_13555 [Methylorubrum sp. B1-46]|nr:hypothetical protein [Methylorubrum sp. B1-46]UGB24008.1 hypothetical protein LPC10_13555 [Methylorubrum sp. B1-46]
MLPPLAGLRTLRAARHLPDGAGARGPFSDHILLIASACRRHCEVRPTLHNAERALTCREMLLRFLRIGDGAEGAGLDEGVLDRSGESRRLQPGIPEGFGECSPCQLL